MTELLLEYFTGSLRGLNIMKQISKQFCVDMQVLLHAFGCLVEATLAAAGGESVAEDKKRSAWSCWVKVGQRSLYLMPFSL